MELRRFHSDPSCVFSEDLSNLQYLRDRYTISGNPIVVDSQFNKTLSFGGTNDGMDIIDGNGEQLSFGSGDFSFVIFYKAGDDQSASYARLFEPDSGVTSARITIYIDSGHAARRIRGSITDDDGNSTGNQTYWNQNTLDDAWHCFALTIDRATPNVLAYIDGEVADTAHNLAGFTTFTFGEMHIAQQTGGGNRLKGELSSFIVFNRILSAAEILDISNGRAF